jgi:lysophospholipase L1-like esterase
MIEGFPHRYEDSCFHHALEKLRKEVAHNIIASRFTMGGFPINRIPKHLEAKCLAAQPDIVVLQFASSDLVVPVRRHHRSDGSVSASHRKTSANPATQLDRLKWLCQGFLGNALSLTPVTPPEIYLENMNLLIRTLLEHRVIPVVLSPFVFGGQRSDRIARDCAGRLQQSMAAFPKAVYVDAYAALDRHPRWRMLLGDGTHLSIEGQKVVGDALFLCLKKLIDKSGTHPEMFLADGADELIETEPTPEDWHP